jgi:hypothetical protein
LERGLERFRFKCGDLKIMKGGICFHPCDEDLSPGARLRKMTLGVYVSVNSRIETAVVV